MSELNSIPSVPEEEEKKLYELLDFKVTDIETHIGQSLSADELHLKMENRMGTRMSQEEEGVVFLYLSYHLGDNDGLFLFDISTQSVIRLPEDEKEVNESNIKDCSVIATDSTIKAIYTITKDMGIAPIDLRPKDPHDHQHG